MLLTPVIFILTVVLSLLHSGLHITFQTVEAWKLYVLPWHFEIERPKAEAWFQICLCCIAKSYGRWPISGIRLWINKLIQFRLTSVVAGVPFKSEDGLIVMAGTEWMVSNTWHTQPSSDNMNCYLSHADTWSLLFFCFIQRVYFFPIHRMLIWSWKALILLFLLLLVLLHCLLLFFICIMIRFFNTRPFMWLMKNVFYSRAF